MRPALFAVGQVFYTRPIFNEASGSPAWVPSIWGARKTRTPANRCWQKIKQTRARAMSGPCTLGNEGETPSFMPTLEIRAFHNIGCPPNSPPPLLLHQRLPVEYCLKQMRYEPIYHTSAIGEPYNICLWSVRTFLHIFCFHRNFKYSELKCAHWRTSRCPPPVAHKHIIAFHGQPLDLAH